MATHPLVLAELRRRAAELEHKAAQLDYRVPGERVSLSASKRHMERTRAQEMARDYRALIELAEALDDA